MKKAIRKKRPADTESSAPTTLSVAALPNQIMVLRAASAQPPDLRQLDACIEDVAASARDQDQGPSDTLDYAELRDRIAQAKPEIVPQYLAHMVTPFETWLNQAGKEIFEYRIEQRDNPNAVIDLSQAILQSGNQYHPSAVAASQELIADLYDGYLSAQDRRGIALPEKRFIAPMVRFGRPMEAPYTWPYAAMNDFGVKCSIVCLPPVLIRSSLLTWSVLAHEVAGHDILSADVGLLSQISNTLEAALNATGLSSCAAYMASHLEEVAADVLAVLNMGPVAAIGLIGFLAGVRSGGNVAGLQTMSTQDAHPPDMLRAYTVIETVRLLKFEGSEVWGRSLGALLPSTGLVLNDDVWIGAEDAKKLASILSDTIINGKFAALEYRPIGSIQNWRDRDEIITAELRAALNRHPRQTLPSGAYASHAVAAAVLAALADEGKPGELCANMQAMLAVMHATNPAWSSTQEVLRGDLVPRNAFA